MNAPRAAAPMPSAGQLALILGGGSALTQVARQLGTVLDRAFADLDLTAQQAALLMHANDADASPTRLMARLGTDTAGMTNLIDRLASKGLLARRRNPKSPSGKQAPKRRVDTFTAQPISRPRTSPGRQVFPMTPTQDFDFPMVQGCVEEAHRGGGDYGSANV